MFRYYLSLALRSFRRNKPLVGLMILAISLGIGGSMTALTIFTVLSGDPIPQKSDRLFYPQLDPRPMNGYVPGGDPEDQMTRFDVEMLLRDRRGDRQAIMVGGSVSVESKGGDRPFIVTARYTTADFFAMFNTPFRHGAGWAIDDDEGRAQVAVISKTLNDKLFGGGNSVGKTLLVSDQSFRVLGVLDEWRPLPKFYDLTNDRFSEVEQVFIPFWTSQSLTLGIKGNMSCWGDVRSDPEGSRAVNAPCSWLQYWVELDSLEKVESYKQYLTSYSEQQHRAGRFERPTNVRLNGVMEWLDRKGVVPSDVRLQLWVAFGFLLVCLLNTVGLLMATFMRRSSEIGVRRALGASRGAIFTQFLIEAGAIGLIGGFAGLILAQFGVWIVRQQADSYASEVHLGASMLLTTFLLAISVSVIAGLLPAWRAMQVSPSLQLKMQ